MNNYYYYLRRMFAFLFDWYLNYIPVYILTLALGFDEHFHRYYILLLMLLISVLMYIVLPFVFKGQTIGQRVFKLRMLKLNNSNLKLCDYILRFLISYMLIEAQFYTLSSYFRTNLFLDLLINFKKITWLPYLTQIIDIIFILLGFGSLIYSLWDKDRCCLHDKIFKVKIVVEN